MGKKFTVKTTFVFKANFRKSGIELYLCICLTKNKILTKNNTVKWSSDGNVNRYHFADLKLRVSLQYICTFNS